MKPLAFLFVVSVLSCVASESGETRSIGGGGAGEGGGSAKTSTRPAALPSSCEDVCDDGDEHDCVSGPCPGSACEAAPVLDWTPCASGDGVCFEGVCRVGG